MSNTRRENRLEELGRVDAEKADTKTGKRNLREEKDRIRSELKYGGDVTSKRAPKDVKSRKYHQKIYQATRPMPPKQKRQPRGQSARKGGRKKFRTHGGGPDAGNIGKLQDALSQFKKKMPTLPKRPDLSKLKERMPKYMKPLRKGGSAKGDKRKKYASGGAVMAGKKVGCQIK